jgi:hypothetical protein
MTKAQEYLIKEMSLFYSFEEFDKEKLKKLVNSNNNNNLEVYSLVHETKADSIIYGYNAGKPNTENHYSYYESELIRYNSSFLDKFNNTYDNSILIKQPNDEKTSVNFYIAGYMLDYIMLNGTKFTAIKSAAKNKLEGISVIHVNFDFKKENLDLKINFKNNTIKPFIFKINTKKYVAPPIDYNKLYLESMSIKHALGQDLINIYFKKANDNYKKTKIELYVKANQEYQLMGEYEVEEGMFFKTINGLAYGNYAYKLIQYDNKNEKIISSELTNFKLSVPNYGGRHTVVRR